MKLSKLAQLVEESRPDLDARQVALYCLQFSQRARLENFSGDRIPLEWYDEVSMALDKAYKQYVTLTTKADPPSKLSPSSLRSDPIKSLQAGYRGLKSLVKTFVLFDYVSKSH